MAPVLAELGGRGVEVDALFVRRRQGPSTPVAEAIADRAVVVSPGLFDATYRGGVTAAEAAAERLSVHLMVPLGLCSLPAFVCWGIVPVLIGLVPDLLG